MDTDHEVFEDDDLEQFVDSVQKIGGYWLQVVTLPSSESVI